MHTGSRFPRLTLGLIAIAGVTVALIPAPAVAATEPTPAPTSTASPSPSATPEPEPEPEPTPEPEPSASPLPDEAAAPTPAPSPTETPAPDEGKVLTQDELDMLGRDSTLDEAVVEEGADTAFRTKSLVGWNPGNIMSDAVFYNGGTMSAAQVQSFLNSKVSSCQSGHVCLKDYRQSTPTRTADRYCPSTYTGAGNESAATIIAKVGQACGINPQVLIVMLQKEQGLVTHTWPSDWRYTIAMGMACPDTAPCDERYYGFFNQVYGAARQLKVYGLSSGFRHNAGQTVDLLYNPNPACGSSRVYIENKATAALYNYTPYQPNQAALNAGYGEGDACSAYGNRNFYNYFTDWFGSTQSPTTRLVQASGQSDIYLISDGTKHRVATPFDLEAFRARLGGVSVVPASYLDALPTGAQATRYVHDTRTGTLYLLESDGTKHPFVDAAQIDVFGYVFWTYVNLEHAILDAYPSGASVGKFMRPGSSPSIYLLEGSTKRYIVDTAAWQQVSRGTSGYVASMSSERAAVLPEGQSVIASNTLVKGKSSDAVYLVLPTGAFVHIPSFGLAAEYGARAYAIHEDRVLSGHPVKSSPLAPLATCDGTAYIAASGTLWPLSQGRAGGLTATALSGAECAAWNRTTTAVSEPVFVSTGGPEVYSIENRALRHVRTPATLSALNGARTLRVLAWSAATGSGVGYGAPYLGDGNIVQFTGTEQIYRFSGGELHHVPTRTQLLTLGGGRIPAVEQLPVSYRSAYTVGAPYLAEGTFVKFDGSDKIYRHTAGELRHVTSVAMLLSLNGGREPYVEQLTASYLSSFRVGSPYVAEGGFVQFTGDEKIYRYTAGELRHVVSASQLLRLNGGREPHVEKFAAELRSSFRIGAPYAAEGSFVKFEGSDMVYRYTGGQLHHVQTAATLLRLNGGREPFVEVYPRELLSAFSVGAPIA